MTSNLIEFLVRLQECRRLINVSPSIVRIPLSGCEMGWADPSGAQIELDSVVEQACVRFEIRGVTPTFQWPSSSSGLERVVWRHLGLDPTLRTAALPARCTRAAADAAIQTVHARDPRTEFRIHTVTSSRGAKLRVYELGDSQRPAWVLALPYGIPVELCFTLARVLARDYRFITFEGPDLLGESADFEHCTHGVDQSASDIRSVMDHFELARAHVAALCAGAMPVLRFAQLHPERVTSVVLGNGSYRTESTSPIDFIALAERVGGSRQKANIFHRFMDAQDLTSIEPECPHWTLLPYSNSELLYRFTTAFRSYFYPGLADDFARWVAEVESPVLLVVGERDQIAPPSGSRLVAAKLKRSSLICDPEGTHLSLVRAPSQDIVRDVLQFCQRNDSN